ncbi:GroES-like protein [Fomitopsis serialis]|uniref:GroES-like protein n=1 Tax=Fomitopsis serialis TaxID=139415 RepID=UPI0020084C41|nr:GroES-like protein [Neoantrodia serialis]KAH9932578.1 GroES-like protein [Neoantrodia serialis]
MVDEIIPKTMKAVLVQPEKKVAVMDYPVPEPGPDDVLVKVVATAQNPTDWKFVDFVQKAGTVLGVDFSGTVVAAGSNVTHLKLGTHVAGFVKGGALPDSGAYAEYVKTPGELVWPVPEGTLGFAEAATLGFVLILAVQALYHPTRLALAELPSKLQQGSEEWVFVYGGSTSVGQYAIQLLRLSGYKSATVCSSGHFDLVKSFGADVVVDRHAPDALQQIRDATGEKVNQRGADSASLQFTVGAMGMAGGRVISLVGQDPAKLKEAMRQGVEVKFTLIYTALGGPAALAAPPSDCAHMAAFLRKVPGLVSAGSIKPNRVKIWEGPGGKKGLEGVESALQWMRDDKVRAEKSFILFATQTLE